MKILKVHNHEKCAPYSMTEVKSLHDDDDTMAIVKWTDGTEVRINYKEMLDTYIRAYTKMINSHEERNYINEHGKCSPTFYRRLTRKEIKQ